MTLIDDFERAHLREFAECGNLALPKKTWRTPDGRWWTPQAVLKGWRPRLSDQWACLALHYWVVKGQVSTQHVELPNPLGWHAPDDPAWAYIEQRYGSIDPLAYPFGRADLACPHESDEAALMVEFGSCAPVKFVLNLGHSFAPIANTHWMIVPYGCNYAFAFVPKSQLFTHDQTQPSETEIH
jgi:hypothetical protein